MFPGNGAKNLIRSQKWIPYRKCTGREVVKNSKYEYRSHKEQCKGDNKETKTLRCNPNQNLLIASKIKNKKIDFEFLMSLN